MEDQAQAPPSEEALRRGYEANEPSMRGLVWFLVVFVLFAIVAHTGLWYLLLADVASARRPDQPRSVVDQLASTRPAVPLQPRPDHDTLPAQDLQSLRSHEDEMFARLGWQVDRDRHRATIPDAVVRAVRQRPPSTQSTTRPTVAGGGQ